MADEPYSNAPARPLSKHSRRTLLRAAAVGTAAVGFLGAARAIGIAEGAEAASEIEPQPASAPVVAYVRDAQRGEVVVMVGTHEVVRRDARLAARLIQLAKEAGDVVAP